MKEITVVTDIRTTEIIQVADDCVDEYVTRINSTDAKRGFAANMKREMGIDDAQIKNVKLFVRDIPEEKKPAKKSRKKKGE